MIFSSASSYPSPSYTLLSTSRARVPNPMLITASHASLLAASRRSPRVLCYSSEQMNYSAAKSVTITAFSATAAAASSSSPSSSAAFEKPELLSPSPPRLDLRSEEEFISRIRKEAEDGKLPPNIAKGMEDLYHNYRNAVFRSVNADAVAVVKANMTFVLECVLKDIKEPFVFSQYHKAVREPFDYYTFGQNYIRPLVDFKNSYVGNVSIFSEMEEKLRQGENVVMMSNHQSEADPAVIALLLESTNRYLAENLIYVAGDRVITDPLCKPFSMGRDLICVFSKKHLYDEPDLTEMKIQANMKSLKDMVRLLRGGSKFLWIAPSGGRDRPDSVTKEWFPAAFDISATENMRRLINHSGVPCHIYPLAILCHDIMPPPAQVEKDIGEKRLINFHGTGISVLPKISFEEVTDSIEDPEEAKKVFTETVYDSVKEQYNVLNCAINEKQGLQASTSTVSLSQSWL